MHLGMSLGLNASSFADGGAPVWRPFGYGTSLIGDWIAGPQYGDMGTGGFARWHDQSGQGHHWEQPDIARQPGLATLFSAVTQTGSGPAMTVTGVANGPYRVIVEIMLGGARGTATFRYSLNAGGTYGDTQTIPSDGLVELIGYGIMLNFAAGTYVLSTTYVFKSDWVTQFDKANSEWMMCNALAPLLGNNSVVPMALLWHGRPRTAPSNGVLFSAGNSASANNLIHLHFPSSTAAPTRAQRTGGTGTSNNRTSTPNPVVSSRLIGVLFDGTNLVDSFVDSTGMTWSSASWVAGNCTFDVCSIGCLRFQTQPTGNLFGDYDVIRMSLWAGTIPDAAAIADWKTNVVL